MARSADLQSCVREGLTSLHHRWVTARPQVAVAVLPFGLCWLQYSSLAQPEPAIEPRHVPITKWCPRQTHASTGPHPTAAYAPRTQAEATCAMSSSPSRRVRRRACLTTASGKSLGLLLCSSCSSISSISFRRLTELTIAFTVPALWPSMSTERSSETTTCPTPSEAIVANRGHCTAPSIVPACSCCPPEAPAGSSASPMTLPADLPEAHGKLHSGALSHHRDVLQRKSEQRHSFRAQVSRHLC